MKLTIIQDGDSFNVRTTFSEKNEIAGTPYSEENETESVQCFATYAEAIEEMAHVENVLNKEGFRFVEGTSWSCINHNTGWSAARWYRLD